MNPVTRSRWLTVGSYVSAVAVSAGLVWLCVRIGLGLLLAWLLAVLAYACVDLGWAAHIYPVRLHRAWIIVPALATILIGHVTGDLVVPCLLCGVLIFARLLVGTGKAMEGGR